MSDQSIEVLPPSWMSLYIETYFNETFLSNATGFVLESKNNFYLITNRHVLTGRHQDTDEPLHSMKAIPNKIKIYLGCKTTVFVFIIDSIGKHFQRLTQTNIEKSMSFYSKEEQNKPAVLITSSNFSKSRGKSKMKTETQEAILETINRYFP